MRVTITRATLVGGKYLENGKSYDIEDKDARTLCVLRKAVAVKDEDKKLKKKPE